MQDYQFCRIYYSLISYKFKSLVLQNTVHFLISIKEMIGMQQPKKGIVGDVS